MAKRLVTMLVEVDPEEYDEPDTDLAAVQIVGAIIVGDADLPPEGMCRLTCGDVAKDFEDLEECR